MPAVFRSILARIQSAAVGLTLAVPLSLVFAPSAQADAQLAQGGNGSASASLNIRVIIPAVMRLLENSHPRQLTVGPDGSSAGMQRLVVMSNMKRGFCVSLSRPAGMEGAWQLRQLDSSPVYVQAVAQGYKVCTMRPGRYTLELEHSFTPAQADPAQKIASLPWPVQTDVNAI
ncbi:hypothetical protein [Hydrogenophaga sp. 5NK40-0174]|uniref:hypothetical protein n=1 Tax=Hydrogenophaga sp. 5NK40-0174 TaxID=3127649 RepID=UPI003107043A